MKFFCLIKTLFISDTNEFKFFLYLLISSNFPDPMKNAKNDRENVHSLFMIIVTIFFFIIVLKVELNQVKDDEYNFGWNGDAQGPREG